MIAYHQGDGILIDLAHTEHTAAQVSYDDTQTQINATNVQEAIEKLNYYFYINFPGWFKYR